MTGPLARRWLVISSAFLALLVAGTAYAQSPLKGKAVVVAASAELLTLKGTTYSLLMVGLESGVEGWVIESLVAREPMLGAIVSSTANLYSQPRDAAVLSALLPLGTFAAVWPVEGKPDFWLVAASVKSAGALSRDRYVRASDVSVRSSDVTMALLLFTAEAMTEESQKKKLLETIDKKYADTALSALVENLRRALTPAEALATEKVSGSFTAQSRLNLRDRPSIAAKVVTLLKEKDVVVVDARTADKATVGPDTDYWYHVASPLQGWAFGAFLAPVSPPGPSPWGTRPAPARATTTSARFTR
jgi:hypothetical protein